MRFRSLRKSKRNNSRINFITAVVFLLGFFIIFKLYDLQVIKSDMYKDIAFSQHSVFSELEPDRGKIFFSDGKEDRYPAAINKEFALVYAVPKDILKSSVNKFSESFYVVFEEEKTKEEVEKNLEEEYEDRLKKDLDFIATLELNDEERIKKEEEYKKKHELLLFDKEYLEWRSLKKEAEIKKRKEEFLKNIKKKLSKQNDPYEPLYKKVDEEKLKKLYVFLASAEGKQVYYEKLELKNGEIINKKQVDQFETLRIKGISHSMRIYRYYPEGSVSSHILGFVAGDEEKQGKYGLEGSFDHELSGERGSVKVERGARSDLLIVNDREHIAPKHGSDLVLTINRSVQFKVCTKLSEAALRHGADGGSVIAINPHTGEIIAMCSWPDYDPNNYKEVEDIAVYNNPAIFESYEPGSTFKTITMAIAIDQGKVTPDTTYNDEGLIMINGWPKPIKNSDYSTHGAHGVVDMNTVLEFSLNTGAIFAMRQAGSSAFVDYVKDFGFQDKTGIELSTEGISNINNLLRKKVPEIYTATASFGQGITATPLQMVMAYGAIANGGVLMKPYIVKEIIHSDGAKQKIKSRQIRRVLSERTTTLVSGMLVNVVEGGHAKRAGVKGYYVGGKTGTAQVASTETRGYGGKTIHTFVGFAPIDDPAFVMLVRLDDPKDVPYAASSAAPLFGEIAEFLLQYYEVPKER